MEKKEIDKAAIAAWDAWYSLWLIKNDLEEIPNEDKDGTIKYILEIIGEKIESIDSLLEERRFADPKYLDCVLSIFEDFKTQARRGRNILEDYEKAKSSLYYRKKREMLEDVIKENELLKYRVTIQEKQQKALEGVLANYIELEKTKKQEAPPIENINTLNPIIAKGQIYRLWRELKIIFPCEYKQLGRLFDDPITQEAPPIQAPTIAHVAVFIEFLKRYGLITTKQPFVTLERVRAFEVRGKSLTSKQMQKPSEYFKFPYSKPYSIEIEKIIKAVANL